VDPITSLTPIRTRRFHLVSMTLPFMLALADRDLATAEHEIGARVPPNMPDDLRDFLGYRIPAVREDPASIPWLGRVIMQDDEAGRRIIGSIGFHAPPDEHGQIEIGYRVEPDHRRQGVASEVAAALLDWARREHGVHRFRASTDPDNVASQAILARLGFREVGSQMDDIDGLELVFELDDEVPSFATLAVHAGAEPDELTGAVAPPIYQTSTYQQDGVGKPRRGYEYARSQNPTRERLERAVAELEGGTHGFAFASGSAATAAIAELAGPGDEVIVGDDVYGGTFRYLERVRKPGAGIETAFVDLAAGTDVLWEALSERTRLVWFETPSNPLLKVVDIAAVARTLDRRANEGGRRPLMVVDNTFASPAIQRPLLLGADIVFHSATKYLAGHSDTIMGVAVTSDDAVAERLRFLQNALGAVPGPLDCFLVLRGLRTLHLRVERHQANAQAVAAFLRGRADLASVSYPGFGGMVSFRPADRPPDAAGGGGAGARTGAERAIAIAEACRLFTLAESLGGVESLIEVPAAMTHTSVAESALEVDPALVRLSVGIEGVDDLIDDLRAALDRA
jgi:cystathionine beta-lyase/cystathionine gamma-synthase/RimJ/RimL family protein N-acetyltransferase